MAIMEPSNLYVCNVMGDLLYSLEDIDKSSVSLHPLLNGQWQLNFEYVKKKDDSVPAFDVLEEGMYILVENTGLFKMRQPTVRIDAATESKTITAYSCDVEFEDHTLAFPINMGTETSLEYQVEYDDDETELLLNPQYHKPYDWIVLYNTYPEQLEKLRCILAQLWTDRSVAYTVHENDEHFDYCVDIVDRISRLRSASVEVGERTEATFTVQDVIDEEIVQYTFEQYVTLTVDNDGNTTAVTFETTFPGRLAAVTAFYQKYRKQLSLLDIISDEMGGAWQPGAVYGFDPDDVEGSDYTIANLRYQFDINEGAYSFLTATYAQRSKCVVNFDILRRKINVTPVDAIGEDTGIALTYDQLLNTLNIQANEDTLATRISVYGAEGLTKDKLSIEQINFGEPYVVDLAYKMNARDKNGNRLYVTDALAEKYDRYISYRESIREDYIDLARQYNKIQADISEIKYRVPVFSQADSAQYDYDTMTEEELDGLLKTYTNALYTLQDLYAEDYGYIATPQGVDSTPWVDITHEASYIQTLPEWFTLTSESNMIPRIEYIRETIYWWDYFNYRQTLTQIYAAMQARYDAESLYKYSEIPETSELYDKIHAWETEWSLYGTVELQNKIDAYTAQLQTMIDGDAVIVIHATWASLATRKYKEATDSSVTNPAEAGWLEEANDSYIATSDTSVVSGKTYYLSLQHCFRDLSGAEFDLACRVLQRRKTWDSLGEEDRKYFDGWAYSNESYVALCNADIVTWVAVAWDDLTDEQRALYGGMSTGYYYANYMKIYNLRAEAQEFLGDMLEGIATMEDNAATIQSQRNELATSARLNTYEHPTTGESFSAYERGVIYLLYRDADYTNEYILASYTDDTVSILDTALKDLYDDAVEQVRTFSRPQLTFTADADNLLSLEAFEAWRDHFRLGNYFYVEYRDGMMIRVRLIGYTYNPCMTSNKITLEFSNLTYTRTKVSDVEHVLGMAGATTSSSGGGSSGGGSGSLSALDELGINLTDTMLKKLLTKESFNKEVSESVKETMKQQASMSKISVYRGLQSGATAVSGNCLVTGNVQSENTCVVTVWTPYFLLPQTLQRTFGNYRDEEYTQALSVIRPFIEMYAGRWHNLSTDDKSTAMTQYWDTRSVYQRSLFSHSSNGTSAYNVFATLIASSALNSDAETPIYENVEIPVSILRLNDGSFSYCGGNFKYGYDGESIEYVYDLVDGYYYNGNFYSDANYTDTVSPANNTIYRDLTTNETYRYDRLTAQFVAITGVAGEDMREMQGKLFIRGQIVATGGNLGGMQIDPASVRPVGLFTVNDAGIQFSSPVETMYLKMATSGYNPTGTGQWINKIAGVDADGVVNFLVKRPITDGSHTNDYDYVSMNVDMIEIGQSRPSGGTTAVLIKKDGTVWATGNISAGGNIAADGAISGASVAASGNVSAGSVTNNGSYAGTGNLRVYGDSKWIAVTPESDTNVTPNSSNKGVSLHSNGRIRASGDVYSGITKLTGGDYAEYFEWTDTNSQHEDRRGRFVTLDKDKIKLATASDDYLLGIITGTPSVLGNGAWNEWHDKHLRDEFGAIITEPVEYPAVLDDDGNVIEEAHVEYEPVINPDYDPTREYIPREQRPEWAPVGLVGQIIMLDDGTCEVNGFATSADEGIATKADGVTNYRVIKRIDSNHIMVAAK